MKDKYPIRYTAEKGDFDKEELKKEGYGGCDQLGIISVIGDFRNGEELSVVLMGMKNDGFEWDDIGWFEIFAFISHKLKDSCDLTAEERQIATDAFESVKKLKVGMTEDINGKD